MNVLSVVGLTVWQSPKRLPRSSELPRYAVPGSSHQATNFRSGEQRKRQTASRGNDSLQLGIRPASMNGVAEAHPLSRTLPLCSASPTSSDISALSRSSSSACIVYSRSIAWSVGSRLQSSRLTLEVLTPQQGGIHSASSARRLPFTPRRAPKCRTANDAALVAAWPRLISAGNGRPRGRRLGGVSVSSGRSGFASGRL